MQARLAIALASLLLPLAACGEPASSNSPIVIRGELNGTFRAGPPAACGPGAITVTGTYGPDTTLDVADLTVDDNGSVKLDAGNAGVFSGSGVAFRAPQGWDIDADASAGITRRIHIRGHLPC